MKHPFYKGKGNHTILELEKLCEDFTQYCYEKHIEYNHQIKAEDLTTFLKLKEAAECINNLEAAHNLVTEQRDMYFERLTSLGVKL